MMFQGFPVGKSGDFMVLWWLNGGLMVVEWWFSKNLVIPSKIWFCKVVYQANIW
jgi:hypothetical protein